MILHGYLAKVGAGVKENKAMGSTLDSSLDASSA